MLRVYRRARRKAKSLFSEIRNRVIETIHPILPEATNKVYDCFLFNNELDILRLRLVELYSSVDHFVICECAIAFSGEDKPLYYSLNQELFASFKDKIQHFVIPNPPGDVYVKNPANPSQMTSEFWQRNQMALAIQSAKENDLILISDVDEIPRASMLTDVSKICYFAKTVVFLSQTWFLLFLDVRVDQKEKVVFASNGRSKNEGNANWLGTFACTAALLRQHYGGNVNGIWSAKWRDHYIANPIVENAGWHFSYMGGMKGLLAKIQANGNKPYSTKDVQDLRQGRFAECILSIETVGETHPKELQQNPQAWNHLMIQENSLTELAFRLEAFLAREESKKV
jgi:beta-1,4-mannosyl-glycoprotein beta-1,4-N-acetylglucosaminyltransferase